MGIKVGCGTFAVARQRYFLMLPTIEIGSAFIQPPKPETAANWRADAPRDFEFSLPASQIITHQADSWGYAKLTTRIPERRRAFCGHFKESDEASRAWAATRAAAAALKPRFIVFETPFTFYPDSNHLRDMYRFFKNAQREGEVFVWHPRGSWEAKLVGKVCADLNLVRAYDPFEEPLEPPRGVRYLRLKGTGYRPEQLSALRRIGEGGQAYAYFTHRMGWLEARKFSGGGQR